MTDAEIRRALEICEKAETDQPETEAVISIAVANYAATLRALLEARELLRETLGDHASDVLGDPCELCPKISAFLAEGEYK